MRTHIGMFYNWLIQRKHPSRCISCRLPGGSQSHLNGCFMPLCPKTLEGIGELQMVLSHYMNAGRVVGNNQRGEQWRIQDFPDGGANP